MQFGGIRIGAEHAIFPKRPGPEQLGSIGLKHMLTYLTGQAISRRNILPNDVLDSILNKPEKLMFGYPSLASAVNLTFTDDPLRRSINIVDADGGVYPIFEREFFLGSFRRLFGNTSVRSILRVGAGLDKRFMDIAGVEAINQISQKRQDAFIGASASWWWLPRQPWLEKFFIENGFEGYVYGLQRTTPNEKVNNNEWIKMDKLVDQAIERIGLKKGDTVGINLFADVWHPIGPVANRWGDEGLFLRWLEQRLQEKGFNTSAHFRLINPFFKPGDTFDTHSGRFKSK